MTQTKNQKLTFKKVLDYQVETLSIQIRHYCVFFIVATSLLMYRCKEKGKENVSQTTNDTATVPFLVVLGVAQDGGYPQVGCKKECCKLFWDGVEQKRHVSCLGIVDKKSGKAWMFDATPDFREQYKELVQSNDVRLEGIFLTHAHIGHYTGIMQLGREVMGSNGVKVYAMPRLKNFLETNGPWSQLVKLNNIAIQQLKNDSTIVIDNEIKITPILVPHRDEYSETVGFRIDGKNKKILFIPDIDKWNLWKKNIIDEIKNVDLAFLDATFYKDGEINRKMSEVPHPFIEESMLLFSKLGEDEKKKVHFIHFNHTNPAFRNTDAKKDIIGRGFRIAEEKQIIGL